MVPARSLGWRDGHAEEFCTRGSSSAEGLLWHSLGAGGSASQVWLWRGAGDAKRGGFGLARRHGALNSERAVVLPGCKCFSEQRQWLRRGHSGRAWSCSLVHVGGLDWEQAWHLAGGSTEQAVSVAWVGMELWLSGCHCPKVCGSGAQPCLYGWEVQDCWFSAHPWLGWSWAMLGSLGSSCWLEMQPGFGKGKRCSRSYGVLRCSSLSCFHLLFSWMQSEFSSFVSQTSVVVAGVTHCS